MLNTRRQLRGITLDHSVLHPWRPVDDVTSIHCGRLRGQCWPTTGHSKTQRGTRLLPFPRGSGVTAAYKKRIPTGTLHPQSPSTPILATPLFCYEIPWDVCSISMTTATDRDGGDCVKRCSERDFRREKGWNVRVTRCKSSIWWGRWKMWIYKQHRQVIFNTTNQLLSEKHKTNIHITVFIHLLEIHTVQWIITNAIQ